MRNESLVKTLNDCIAHCNWCADACLDEDNVQMMAECIRLDRICAETCKAATMAVVSNSSTNTTDLIRACQTMCEKCADECSKHENDHCRACAEACRKCAQACSEFAA